MMKLHDIKKQVIDTALHLTELGLIARTWGNVSLRIDSETMLITPSGRRYETMVPDDIVLMNINNFMSKGKFRASEEKRIHAAAYRMNSRTRAVIHTHQPAASAVAAARKSISVKDPQWQQVLGSNKVKCGGYALPGTKKLTRRTVSVLQNAKSCLLANHGVVCTGETVDEAIQVALTLEKAAQAFIEYVFCQTTGQEFSIDNMHVNYLASCNV